ncbi:MAG: GNAT family N-acetyltransferase [Bacteroidota bacterium]|nr:GNAT family N-acetyltransferase [Bacteroidota bacterium]
MSCVIHTASDEQMEIVRQLFREYEKELDEDLCFQGFEEELAGLPGKYAPPDGRLLLATSGEKICGCVALRKMSDNVCEMKRLFVRPEFRGSGTGRGLAVAIIREARAAGYRTMRLDTLQKLQPAIALYHSLGFKTVEPYYHSLLEGTVYMELEVGDSSSSL